MPISDLEPFAHQLDIRRAADTLRDAEQFLLGGAPPAETGLALFMEESRIYYVLQEVERLDREMRRVSRAFRSNERLPLEEALAEAVDGDTRRFDPTPADREPSSRTPGRSGSRYLVDTPRASSLRLADAAEGSTDLLLLPLGTLVTVFASAPMTAVANALAWSGPITRVRAWAQKRSRETTDLPLKQVFRVLQEAGGDPGAIFGEPSAEVVLSDGTEVRVRRGMTAVVIRTHADGSSDYVEIRGD
jgi:hypothetical protein